MFENWRRHSNMGRPNLARTIDIASLTAQEIKKIRSLIFLALPPSNGKACDETVHQIDDMFGRGKASFK